MPNPQTILHVEDNPENRLLVKRLLMSCGYAVAEAENANQALIYLRENRPDLILMDINMPDVDGYTLTNRLKSIPEVSRVPVIALTANVMRGDRERSFEAGCDGYIEKPIDIDTFLDQIARYLPR